MVWGVLPAVACHGLPRAVSSIACGAEEEPHRPRALPHDSGAFVIYSVGTWLLQGEGRLKSQELQNTD